MLQSRKQPPWFAVAALAAVLLWAATPRLDLALAGGLTSPAQIAKSVDYPAVAQKQLVAALRREGCKFLSGRFVNWISILTYEGDRDAVNGLVADLVKCPGVTVTVAFKALEKGDWLVVHDGRKNTLHIELNLGSKRIDPGGLVLPGIKGPVLRVGAKPNAPVAVPAGTRIRTGALISLEVRARDGLFLDIDGDTGDIMPLRPYTHFGGCDWILNDVGEGSFSLQNRFSRGFLGADPDKLGRVALAEYNPSRGQDWRFVRLPNRRYKLVNRHWTEKAGKEIVLDIVGENDLPIVAPYSDWGGGCDWKIERR